MSEQPSSSAQSPTQASFSRWNYFRARGKSNSPAMVRIPNYCPTHRRSDQRPGGIASRRILTTSIQQPSTDRIIDRSGKNRPIWNPLSSSESTHAYQSTSRGFFQAKGFRTSKSSCWISHSVDVESEVRHMCPLTQRFNCRFGRSEKLRFMSQAPWFDGCKARHSASSSENYQSRNRKR